MTIENITAEIQDIIDDDSFDDTAVVTMINKAIAYISARVNLPALEEYHTETGVTGTSFDLPDNYQRGLFSAESVYDDIEILPSARHLARDVFGDGRKLCAVSGGTLKFSDSIDASMDITIGYYRAPYDDEVDILPDGFGDDPIINYCCWKFFAKIEDGHTDSKPNTRYYKAQLDENIKDLRVKVQESQPNYRVTSEGSDFSI